MSEQGLQQGKKCEWAALTKPSTMSNEPLSYFPCCNVIKPEVHYHKDLQMRNITCMKIYHQNRKNTTNQKRTKIYKNLKI